jgi:hypothetical protein
MIHDSHPPSPLSGGGRVFGVSISCSLSLLREHSLKILERSDKAFFGFFFLSRTLLLAKIDPLLS